MDHQTLTTAVIAALAVAGLMGSGMAIIYTIINYFETRPVRRYRRRAR